MPTPPLSTQKPDSFFNIDRLGHLWSWFVPLYSPSWPSESVLHLLVPPPSLPCILPFRPAPRWMDGKLHRIPVRWAGGLQKREIGREIASHLAPLGWGGWYKKGGTNFSSDQFGKDRARRPTPPTREVVLSVKLYTSREGRWAWPECPSPNMKYLAFDWGCLYVC